MSDLDLDIQNYSLHDLEDFFKLGKKYSLSDVEKKEFEIREQLLSSGHIKPRFKTDLIHFLENAREMLFHHHPDYVHRKPPTEIPKDWRLDSMDFPVTKGNIPTREQEIVHHPNAQFVYSKNHQFYSGNLNPLDTRIIHKYMTIDSRFRDNYFLSNASDFTVQFPTKLNKVVSMQLTSINIPMAFYTISSSYGNHFLNISVNQTYKTTVIVPDGNYSSSDLIAKINALLCPRDASGNIINPTNIFSFVVLTLDISSSGSGTGKVTIQPVTGTALGNSIQSIALDFTKNINGIADTVDITTKLGWNLGFTQKTYTGSPSCVSDSIINPVSLKYIYLSVEDYQTNVHKLFLSAFHQNNIHDNILALISLKNSSFTSLVENDFNLLTEPRTYFGPVDIQRLRIRLFDDHNRPLNFNNADFSFVLLFKMVYDL